MYLHLFKPFIYSIYYSFIEEFIIIINTF